MVLLGIAALLLAAPPGASPDPKALDVPPAEREAARALVRRLGSPVFTDRDEASRRLHRMGRLALPVLTKAAASDPDPEVRYRCELLIPAAAADDFDARLAAFLADEDGKYEHHLPGWAEFRKLTGDDPLARALFTELLKSPGNRELIAGMAQDRGELTRRVLARRAELYERMYPRGPGVHTRYEPTLLDAAGLLFCEALIGDKDPPRGVFRTMTPYTLMLRSGAFATVDTDKYGPAVKKLAVAWMDSRETAGSLSQAMTFATRLGLPGGVKYAARIIRAPGATAYQRASAAASVARAGTRGDLPHLKPLLTDEAVVRPASNELEAVQVRDVALAMSALLAGRDPAEFGLRAQSPGESAKFYYYNYAFASEEDREKGFARWAELEPKYAPGK